MGLPRAGRYGGGTAKAACSISSSHLPASLRAAVSTTPRRMLPSPATLVTTTLTWPVCPQRLVRDRDCNLNGVTPETEETPVTDVTTSQGREPVELSAADELLLRELTERARTGGVRLTGEGGLLGRLTKMVVEGALEGELD